MRLPENLENKISLNRYRKGLLICRKFHGHSSSEPASTEIRLTVIKSIDRLLNYLHDYTPTVQCQISFGREILLKSYLMRLVKAVPTRYQRNT